jgi:hypothetical protein
MPRVSFIFRCFVWLAMPLFLVRLTFAQNISDPCYDGEFATFNATASSEIYAMHPQDPLNGTLYGHYIISTAVKEIINVAQNNSIVKQKFWLKADQTIITAPLNLPFAGCAFFLQAAPGSSLIGGNPSDTLCQNVLPGDCEQAILGNVTGLPQAALDNNFDTCAALTEVLRIPPLECKGAEWDSVMAVRRYPHEEPITLGDD